jgi:hypothetical protein
MKSSRRRIDVNLDELDRVLDGARQEPLSEADYDKLKGVLHAMAAMLVRPRNTEKTSAVVEPPEGSATTTVPVLQILVNNVDLPRSAKRLGAIASVAR